MRCRRLALPLEFFARSARPFRRRLPWCSRLYQVARRLLASVSFSRIQIREAGYEPPGFITKSVGCIEATDCVVSGSGYLSRFNNYKHQVGSWLDVLRPPAGPCQSPGCQLSHDDVVVFYDAESPTPYAPGGSFDLPIPREYRIRNAPDNTAKGFSRVTYQPATNHVITDFVGTANHQQGRGWPLFETSE